jgi:ABC-type Fe3+-hydroxamate transport system substrate-binding protein
MIQVPDDTGRIVSLAQPPRRIVSLVPSLTETLFSLGCGDAVVGVTRFCEEPAAAVAQRPKVGGTKNPDCEAIGRLDPDLVLVNAEENRREDFSRLEQMGLNVFVTFPATLDDTVGLLRRLGQITGCAVRGQALANELAEAVAEVRRRVHVRRRVFCPIWKNPWMTVGGGTYVDDVLWTAGGANIFRDEATPYPRIELADVAARQPEAIVLPDEPYRFSASDLPDLGALLDQTPAWKANRVHFVDGKMLSWYGPRAAAGVRFLASLLG